MDWDSGRYGQCGDQTASDGISVDPKLHGGFLRQQGPVAVRDRSASVPGGAGSGTGTAFPGQRAARAVESATGSGSGSSITGAGESAPDATRRGSLYTAGKATGGFAAGPRQR